MGLRAFFCPYNKNTDADYNRWIICS